MSEDRLRLRLALVAEEVAELVAAMCCYGEDETNALKKWLVASFDECADDAGNTTHTDLAEVAKELVDVHAVVSGTAVEYGIPEDRAYAEVHRANMAKRNEVGRKLVKPEGWTPPDVARAIGAE